MEFQKILNFLNTNPDENLPRFFTKKWIEVYDQSGGIYNVNKEIRIEKSVLRSNLCDYSDAYIVGKGTVTVVRPNDTKRNKATPFKNNAPSINCISKINGEKIDNAEDLDIVMPMYNLLEYSKNYRKTTGSLWNYCRDEPRILFLLILNLLNARHMTRNIYNVSDDEEGYDANKVGKNETEVVAPLKHLSNFWKALNIPLNNCKVELILTWSKKCVLADVTRRNARGNNPAIVAPDKITFEITNTKLYVPVVTLSKENDIKLLEL